MRLLVVDEAEDFLAHVEVALDGTRRDRKLGRRVGNLVQFELTVDLSRDLEEIVEVVDAAERGENVADEEAVVKVVLGVVVLLEHLQQHLRHFVSRDAVVADVQH